MVVLFKDIGVCAMYSYEDSDLQSDKLRQLNEQPSSVFTNEIFESNEAVPHLKLENALFNEDEKTLGIWKLVAPTDNVAVSIRYRVSDIMKLMPSFVNQLNVPLVVISEAQGKEVIYMRDKSQGCHFNNAWELTDNGYRNTSISSDQEE